MRSIETDRAAAKPKSVRVTQALHILVVVSSELPPLQYCISINICIC